jgi:tRNA pseudouridine55 synthase
LDAHRVAHFRARKNDHVGTLVVKETDMDGVINFYKPTGITSAKALYKVRSITGQRKSGHAGTLDPAASGVLILCMGKATKLVEAVMDYPKVYRTTARLDATSESYDSDRPLVPVDVTNPPSETQVRAALAGFEGTIQQVPPNISAIKIGGVPSYKLAGTNRQVELAPRPVQVSWLHLHSYEFPMIDFEMCCGRGTYVRSLIRDLGTRLGAGGVLTSLVRTQIGPLRLESAWTLDALQTAASPLDCLIELTAAKSMFSEGPAIPPRPR